MPPKKSGIREVSGPARMMEHMTVKEVRAALKKKRTVIVPLGVLEQHGYHLPLSTDIHNAREVSARVSERTGALVAPVLNYAFSGGELPGTINISPLTMALAVTDICGSLAVQGFRNILLVLGHGGTENLNALRDSLVMFLRNNPKLRKLNLALVPIWKYSSDWMRAFEEGDYHAGYVETSLMLYWAPELVREKIETDEKKLLLHMRKHQDNYLDIKKNIDSEEVVPFVRQRGDIEVGVMGDPYKASREIGKKICEDMVDGICELLEKMEESE